MPTLNKYNTSMVIRLAIILSLICLAIFWPPILIFTIPGILLLFIPVFKEIELTDLLIFVIGISISFWICSFWFLESIRIGLVNYFFLIVFISLIGCVFLICSNQRRIFFNISLHFRDALLLAIFSWVLYLRVLPIRHFIAASGADMSMHTYITYLMLYADGIPNNYYPILEIESFTTFPVGFHTLSVLITFLSSAPPYTSTFIMTSFSFFALTLFLYFLLKKHVDWKFALISSLIFTFYTANPQDFVRWGGNPTVLALSLLVLSLAFLDRIERGNGWCAGIAGLSFASVALTHTIVFVQAFYTIGVSFFVYFLLRREYRSFDWVKYPIILAVFGLALFPYLMTANFEIATPNFLERIRIWVRETIPAWPGGISNAFWDVAVYIKRLLFGGGKSTYLFLPVLFIGWVDLFRCDRKKCIEQSVFLGACVLLIINTQYWVLPFSYLIYPERLAVMSIISLSLFLAVGMSRLLDLSIHFGKISAKVRKLFSILFLFFIAVHLPIWNEIKYTNLIRSSCSLTEDDLDVFYWLQKHISGAAVIANNYGDGGVWIPSIILRPVTNPHVNFAYEDKILTPQKPEYAYVGSRCVWNPQCELKTLDLDRNTNKYKLLYRRGGASIYKMIG